MLRRNRWQPLYRGVYASFTGKVSEEGLLWAALLRCGRDAVLSHLTAAAIEGFAERRSGATHVTISQDRRLSFAAGEFHADLPRIVLHRSRRITEITHPARLPPRTRTAETVLDLAEQAKDVDAMYSWLSLACSRGLVNPGQLRAAATRRPRLRRRSQIMAALEEIADGALSSLERRYHRDVERAHGLPSAQRQVKTRPGGRSAYLDNLYRAFRLIVELDGLQWHPAAERWLDVRRDNYFASNGLITLRYNWADVTVRPCEVANQIAQVMRFRGWKGALRSCGPACRAAN